jgi:hypothetical protein
LLIGIALGLHRNSTNDMHIYDFLLHLLVQFTYIYTNIGSSPWFTPPSHQRIIVAARLVILITTSGESN